MPNMQIPVQSLVKTLYHESVTLYNKNIQNFSDVICQSQTSQIRKQSILLFEKTHPTLSHANLSAYALHIVSQMRNCENSIVQQRGLYLSRTIYSIPKTDEIQLEHQRISSTDEIIKNISTRLLNFLHERDQNYMINKALSSGPMPSSSKSSSSKNTQSQSTPSTAPEDQMETSFKTARSNRYSKEILKADNRLNQIILTDYHSTLENE